MVGNKKRVYLSPLAIDILEKYTRCYARKDQRDRFLHFLKSPANFHKWWEGPAMDGKLCVARKAHYSKFKSFGGKILELLTRAGLADAPTVMCSLGKIIGEGKMDSTMCDVMSIGMRQQIVFLGKDDTVYFIYIGEYNDIYFSANLWHLIGKYWEKEELG